ncbi:MAG TPA: nitroreductase family protein [Alphaproteobacteria bacterium]|nr:nitroreductase family protein [Alphaproteobacteria bacterium]
MLNLTVDELLTTTRTVRKRLDLKKPVPRAIVEECMTLALQAPNGSNNQSFEFVIVEDPDIRRKVAEIYRAGMQHFVDMIAKDPSIYSAHDTGRSHRREQMSESTAHLNEHMHEVPLLIIPTLRGRMDGQNIFYQASLWGSVWPVTWNLMLALRSRGLGTALTTVHLWREREMADLLRIPFDRYTQTGLIPVAYTIGTNFKPGDRVPASEVMHWNRW